MAAVTGGDGRATLSPRSKGRDPSKDKLCRWVTIYGHCRYEGKGCEYNHPSKQTSNQSDLNKKRFNVDSPSFTPASTTLNVNNASSKVLGLSPKAASAAPFQPKGLSSSTTNGAFLKKPYNPTAPDWAMGASLDAPEFLPSQSVTPSLGESNGNLHQPPIFDPYVSPSPSLSGTVHNAHQPQINPYAQDTTGNGGASYYQEPAYTQPIQYHLYTPLGPHRDPTHQYQRTVQDFFISDTLREDLQRKSAAAQQILPNSKLPPQIDHFYSLVPLDTNNQRNTAIFGYASWIYKVVSSKDGNTYALRRLEGYRLTKEQAIRNVQAWKRVNNSSLVTVQDIFTNRSFGDSALMIITDYFPLAKTLAEVHFPSPNTRFNSRGQNVLHVPEQTIWSYMVQICNALKTIHGAGLAARIIEPSKVLLTNKNRIRLNACAIMDVVEYENAPTKNLLDYQRADFFQLGQLLLSVGTNIPLTSHNTSKAMETFSRSYSGVLKDRVSWLLSMGNVSTKTESIDTFITSIASQTMSTLDSSLSLDDTLHTELNRELENGRIVRIMTKLNCITERPDYNHDRQWSETGERFPIKLFRDYVFHQVDAQGNPVMDLAHILGCLNKLDAGSEEKFVLTSRDEQIVIVVSYREMKRAVENAYGDLVKAGRSGAMQ